MKLQREDIHPLQDTCPYFCFEVFQNGWFGAGVRKRA